MAAEIALYTDPDREFEITELALSEVQEPYSTSLTEGEPVQIYGRNVGDSTLRDLALYLSGEGSDKVQLAVDRDGEPGVWAAEGQSVALRAISAPGDDFSFWARAIFKLTDREGAYGFDFHFRGIAIG